MDRKLKILELLEKKNISEQEIKELERLAENDEELKNFISTYNNLADIVRHSSHLTEEEISDYILFKNEIFRESNVLIKRIPFIEAHLRECSHCTEVFKELNNEYSEIDIYLAENPVLAGQPSEENITVTGDLRGKYKAPRYAFISVIIIGLVYLTLYIISSYTAPDFYKEAALKNESEISINRGRTTENFQKSLKALENSNYTEAISFLQKDIQQNPDDETIFYSYYIIGLSYLETAEHNFIGLFPGYNYEQAMNGKKYLEESVMKNTSGSFINIKLNSYFYLAKASLMLNDKRSAEKYLSMVINGKGSKMEEAKKLLGELE
jgi:hypothetical protein